MKYILETKHLTKKYKRFYVLDNINMHIKAGSIYGLIGKNGAGKTTLMKVLTGIVSPSKGTYLIYRVGYQEKEIYETRKRLSAMVETPALFENMTAKENLIYEYKIIGMPSLDGIDELLNLVGLKDAGNKKVINFSLGMKQRLGIAIALASNPDFLILDEPINGLDPEGIIDIRELILKLNRVKGITILVSSHYLDELSKIATDYGFLHEGKLIEELSAEELNQKLRKKIEIKTDKLTETVEYLEKKKIEYEVLNKNQIIIYGDINISKMVLELSKKECTILDIKEKNESLENYFLKIVGEEND